MMYKARDFMVLRDRWSDRVLLELDVRLGFDIFTTQNFILDNVRVYNQSINNIMLTNMLSMADLIQVYTIDSDPETMYSDEARSYNRVLCELYAWVDGERIWVNEFIAEGDNGEWRLPPPPIVYNSVLTEDNITPVEIEDGQTLDLED